MFHFWTPLIMKIIYTLYFFFFRRLLCTLNYVIKAKGHEKSPQIISRKRTFWCPGPGHFWDMSREKSVLSYVPFFHWRQDRIFPTKIQRVAMKWFLNEILLDARGKIGKNIPGLKQISIFNLKIIHRCTPLINCSLWALLYIMSSQDLMHY